MRFNYSTPKIYLLLFLLLLSPPIGAAQGSPTAKIVAVQGAVQITRIVEGRNNRMIVQTAKGGDLFSGDVIKTSAGGRLVLGLRDGSQAIISENTTVEIKDTSGSPRTIFNVLRGKTRIQIEKMGGKPNPYRVTTPTTVIAVRGTIFDVFVKGERTEVFVTEGEVSVTNLLTPLGEVVLLPGQFTRVEKDAPPQKPATFKPSRNDADFRERTDSRDRRQNSDGNDGDRQNRDNRDNRDDQNDRDNRNPKRDKDNQRRDSKRDGDH